MEFIMSAYKRFPCPACEHVSDATVVFSYAFDAGRIALRVSCGICGRMQYKIISISEYQRRIGMYEKEKKAV